MTRKKLFKMLFSFIKKNSIKRSKNDYALIKTKIEKEYDEYHISEEWLLNKIIMLEQLIDMISNLQKILVEIKSFSDENRA